MEPSATFKPNLPLEQFFFPLAEFLGLGLPALDIPSVIAAGFASGSLKKEEKKNLFS